MTLLGQKPLDQMPCTARSVVEVAALGFPSPMVSVDVKRALEERGCSESGMRILLFVSQVVGWVLYVFGLNKVSSVSRSCKYRQT